MRKVLLFSAMAVIASVGLAHANTINGSLWAVPEAVVNSPTGATPGNVPVTTPDVTFSVNSPFDFHGDSLTVGDWLASSSAFNISGTPAALARLMDDGLPNNTGTGTLVNFTGDVSVTNGQIFTVTHDDGLQLFINGLLVVDEAGPHSPTTDSHTYGGPTGTFAFQLVYSECCGGPAVLQLSLPFEETSPTPLPGALPLFASGLGVMGLLGWRRKRKAAAVIAA